MSNEVLKSLEVICDKRNPQDKKLLLLAQLVDEKYSSLEDDYKEIKQSLYSTNEKIDSIMETLQKSSLCQSTCPVHKEGKALNSLIFAAKNPKLMALSLIGALVVAMGVSYSGALNGIIEWLAAAFTK